LKDDCDALFIGALFAELTAGVGVGFAATELFEVPLGDGLTGSGLEWH
jgi:hypothetical protein